MRPHQSLAVYRRSQAAIIRVYEICDSLPPYEKYGLATQLRRAAVSVRSNILEGSRRRTGDDFAHFLNIAEGSAAEARGLLIDIINLKMDYLGKADALQREYAEIELMLRALRRRYRGDDD
jgi:four helix bundle protein